MRGSAPGSELDETNSCHATWDRLPLSRVCVELRCLQSGAVVFVGLWLGFRSHWSHPGCGCSVCKGERGELRLRERVACAKGVQRLEGRLRATVFDGGAQNRYGEGEKLQRCNERPDQEDKASRRHQCAKVGGKLGVCRRPNISRDD